MAVVVVVVVVVMAAARRRRGGGGDNDDATRGRGHAHRSRAARRRLVACVLQGNVVGRKVVVVPLRNGQCNMVWQA